MYLSETHVDGAVLITTPQVGGCQSDERLSTVWYPSETRVDGAVPITTPQVGGCQSDERLSTVQYLSETDSLPRILAVTITST